jgi:DNA-binding XRE family transcriptional regulator
MRVPPPASQIMTYDPEANEAMQKPNALAASASDASDRDRASKPKANKKSGNKPNNVRKIRIERMMSKAELARRANLSVLTIDRVEKGFGCRMDTKRKILEALGLRLADRVRVFGEEE